MPVRFPPGRSLRHVDRVRVAVNEQDVDLEADELARQLRQLVEAVVGVTLRNRDVGALDVPQIP